MATRARGQSTTTNTRTGYPHVTLAEKGLEDESLSLAVRLFSQRRLQWTIDIDNLAFIDATGPKQELTARFKLRG